MTLIIRIKGDRKSGEVNWRQQYQVHGPFQHDYQYQSVAPIRSVILTRYCAQSQVDSEKRRRSSLSGRVVPGITVPSGNSSPTIMSESVIDISLILQYTSMIMILIRCYSPQRQKHRGQKNTVTLSLRVQNCKCGADSNSDEYEHVKSANHVLYSYSDISSRTHRASLTGRRGMTSSSAEIPATDRAGRRGSMATSSLDERRGSISSLSCMQSRDWCCSRLVLTVRVIQLLMRPLPRLYRRVWQMEFH